ncbi:MAG: CDP-alcohol phosphatidyltransferase family protein [Oceanospirillaceae bacterium]|jgi:phosphatidylglycerophosphate synthase|nr:CDP-alcohol phosphatidyltransferase family protein [Oceanospirillaceae bacterium]MBT4444198.1 CDP-alcohol phosphatidyltransferase family protein [Oceanospirillaceae bacterium]
MIDHYITPLQQRLLKPLAQSLVKLGVQADQITLLGFFIGLGAVPLLAFGHYYEALALILLNRFMDGVDGAVARLSISTDRGAFLDIALDFMFYALVPLGFAFAEPANNALAAAVLLTAFVGTGSSFLGFALFAAKRGIKAEAYANKGIYYLGGLTEGAETIGFFVIICVWPNWFSVAAYGFAGACYITTLMRWFQGWRLLQGHYTR